MTQQDIVNQLNRLVVGYNITWEDIKYDADRAIMNINNRLGAKFPMMSQVLVGSNVSYELDTIEGNIPIIQDQYILTVIIPFIASEILARDEEFTTIYNKYLMDYENGLFDMFQYEFNRIPLAFRQSKDVGVFFGYDTPQRKVHDTIEKNLPLFKFKIYYYLNVDYNAPDNFTFDNNLYDYGANITVKAPTVAQFIKEHYLYTFSHWSTRPDDTNAKTYYEGDKITNINGTVHLYAVWLKESIINIDESGGIILNSINVPIDLLYIDKLVIPSYIDSILVSHIKPNFNSDFSINTLVLPAVDLTIDSGAFGYYETPDENPSISEPQLTLPANVNNIVFPEYNWIKSKPNITISNWAIYVESIYLPYSVRTIGYRGIKAKNIKCQILSNEKPNTWHYMWCYTSTSFSTNIEWGVING